MIFPGISDSTFTNATLLYEDESIKKSSCDLGILCYSLTLLPNNVLFVLSHHEKKLIKFNLSIKDKVTQIMNSYARLAHLYSLAGD